MTAPLVTAVRRTTDQSISNNTWTAVSFDASTPVINDVSGAFNTGTPTQVTVPSGYTKVRITAFVNWANTSTSRGLRVRKNSTVIYGDSKESSPNEGGTSLEMPWLSVSAGDVIDLQVIQVSGGNLNLSGTAFGGSTELQCEWQT